MMGQHPELDERDQEILVERVHKLNQVDGPRVGDFVDFADGVQRRISYIWPLENRADFIQTSTGGTYYLAHGHVSMSGGLYDGVKSDTLTLTDEMREGSVWFFHHDWHTAHNGVGAMVAFRVFACSEEAPQ